MAAESLLRTVNDQASLVELYFRWSEGALLNGDSATATKLIELAEKAGPDVDSSIRGRKRDRLQAR